MHRWNEESETRVKVTDSLAIIFTIVVQLIWKRLTSLMKRVIKQGQLITIQKRITLLIPTYKKKENIK